MFRGVSYFTPSGLDAGTERVERETWRGLAVLTVPPAVIRYGLGQI